MGDFSTKLGKPNFVPRENVLVNYTSPDEEMRLAVRNRKQQQKLRTRDVPDFQNVRQSETLAKKTVKVL